MRRKKYQIPASILAFCMLFSVGVLPVNAQGEIGTRDGSQTLLQSLSESCPDDVVYVNPTETLLVPDNCSVDTVYNRGGIVTNYGRVRTIFHGDYADGSTLTNYGSIFNLFIGWYGDNNEATNFGNIEHLTNGFRGSDNTVINNGFVSVFRNGYYPSATGNFAINEVEGSINAFYNGRWSSGNTAINYGTVGRTENGVNMVSYTATNNTFDNYGDLGYFVNRTNNILNRHCFSSISNIIDYGGTYNDLCPPPVAHDDSYNLMEGTKLNIDVLSNDTGEDLTVYSFDGTSLYDGAVTMDPDGSLVYVPATGFAGVDTFSYTVTDAFDELHTATVEMTVNVMNRRSIQIESVDGTVVGQYLIGTILISDQSENGKRDDLLVQIIDFETVIWWQKGKVWFTYSSVCADHPTVFGDKIEVQYQCELTQAAQESERIGLGVNVSIFGRDKVIEMTQFIDEKGEGK